MLRSFYVVLKTLLIFIGIALVAGLAWLLAIDPGSVVIDWRNIHVSTSVGVGIGILILLIIAIVLLFRLLWSIFGIPRALGRAERSRRQRKGVRALSKGMAAIAAGDAAVAKDQAARASDLLDDRTLTMLLQAQAAQLQGDETAAEKYFAALRDWPSTEFLGVRGLLTQAMKRGAWDEALTLAKRAYRINRKSEWVVRTLFELQKRTGRWADARETLKDMKSLGLMSRADMEAEDANLLYQLSLESQGPEAISLAKKAYAEQPSLAEAGTRVAQLLLDHGDPHAAAKRIEEAWQRSPSPELAELYWRAKGAGDPAKKLEAAKRLVARNAAAPESRLVLGAAALAASNWTLARETLEPLATTHPTPRLCRLMATLEEKQHGDLERARAWLMRAAGDEIEGDATRNAGAAAASHAAAPASASAPAPAATAKAAAS
jgi:HemY protein